MITRELVCRLDIREVQSMETRPCSQCHGTGIMSYGSYLGDRPCNWCHGRKVFASPDYRQIIKDVCTSRGNKGFRESPPSLDRETERGARAYFVWRMARFHGGADVTMPIMAELAIKGDPWEKELDAFAGLVAERVFGTQMAAASRWSGLLYNQVDIPGLPPTAY